MEFIVGKEITVLNPNAEIRRWCEDHLVIENPDYDKKVRLGVWLGNTPRTISLYETRPGKLIIPFGCLKELFKSFRDFSFKPLFKPVERFSYESSISLYDYQKEALKASLKARNGVIVMPCGSGKTQTALALVASIGGRCLWLTHTQDLLNQSMNRAKACFDIPASWYGTITEGKANVGRITFATVQTMSKLDLSRYEDAFDVVIVDECHKCVGSPTRVMQFYRVLSNLNARYKYGLTATPKRSDGLEQSMFALLGDIICEIPRETVANTTCPVKVRLCRTQYKPNLDLALAGDGTINYAGLVEDLTHNIQRIDLVSNALNALEGATLVLANRVEYLQELDRIYNGRSVCLSTLGKSKSAKAERKEALRRLNNGELDCIFATYQLAKEGLDVPQLRYVVFATPEKDETTVIQSAGRVGRKAEGKEFGTVIDFLDNFGMYNGWAKKRQGYYRKLGYEIQQEGK